MRILILFQLLTSTLAVLSPNIFTSLLLLNQYGGSSHRRGDCRFVVYPRDGGPPRRRCRRSNNNDLFRLALFSALTPSPAPAPAPPPPPPGCFPDAMTIERQTKGGGSETISVANLTLGDNVRCLKAPRGPRTVNPGLGWCKLVSKNHDSNSSEMYDQLLFVDKSGEEQMIAATGSHLVWRSTDTTLKGTVNPAKISIDNSMFVPIAEVNPGDVIIVERDNQWEYRTVTDHRVEYMKGLRNPQVEGGGLPIVNGVLATTSVTTYRGGHWGAYFQYIWMKDWKFSNTSDVFWDYRSHPFSLAQKKNGVKVDLDCLMDHLFEDTDKGIDVTDFNNYDAYVKAYLLPCVQKQIPTLLDLGKRFLEEFY